MKLKKLKLSLAISFLLSTTVQADLLTDNYGTHLMNAQIIQVDDGSIHKIASIGYYHFKGNGIVQHYRLHLNPSSAYTNTFITTEHINVPIQDLYTEQEPHDLIQNCTQTDMGQMVRPTSATLSSFGTYTFNGTQLVINIENKKSIWTLSTKAENRGLLWESSGNISDNTSGTSVTNSLAFGYFSDGVGIYPLDFKTDFFQGTTRSSTTGYYGRLYSNGNITNPSDTTFPIYFGEHKVHMRATTNIGSDSQAHQDTYSSIWYYPLFDQAQINAALVSDPNMDVEKGLMVQTSVKTNYYTAFPTLVYENTGHIFHGFLKNIYTEESATAFNSRHCWTDSDTYRTQGHTKIHLGAWNNNQISDIVTLEVSKNPNYPYMSIGYGSWTN